MYTMILDHTQTQNEVQRP